VCKQDMNKDKQLFEVIQSGHTRDSVQSPLVVL